MWRSDNDLFQKGVQRGPWSGPHIAVCLDDLPCRPLEPAARLEGRRGAEAYPAVAMALLAGCRRWLHRKQYQFETTFCVYIFTPWEKFAFCRCRCRPPPPC